MKTRLYTSNLPREWSIERQLRALAAFLPKGRMYCDELSPADRQGRRREFMVQLDGLLRSTTKPQDEETVVAVLGAMDWTEAGLLDRIARIQDRGGMLRVVVPPLLIGPKATTRELHTAIEAFHATKHRKPKSEERGRAGAAESAQRRWGEVEAKIQAKPQLKELWQIGDQRAHKSDYILSEIGVSRNTMLAHCGYRKGPR